MGRGRARWAGILLPSLFLSTPPVSAEVVSSAETGFVTQESAVVPVPPARVWPVLIEPARWWNPEHSWSGNGANLTLAAHAGGCFCEKLPQGGSVEHMRVVHAAPGALLRMTGALGPLQSEALSGTLTVELAAEGSGTRVSWTYVVGGHSRFALADLAPAVDSVQSEQLARLAAALGAKGAN